MKRCKACGATMRQPLTQRLLRQALPARCAACVTINFKLARRKEGYPLAALANPKNNLRSKFGGKYFTLDEWKGETNLPVLVSNAFVGAKASPRWAKKAYVVRNNGQIECVLDGKTTSKMRSRA